MAKKKRSGSWRAAVSDNLTSDIFRLRSLKRRLSPGHRLSVIDRHEMLDEIVCIQADLNDLHDLLED